MESPTFENKNDVDDNQKITVVCAVWNSDKVLRAKSNSEISDSSTTNSSILEISSNENIKEPKFYIKRRGFPVFLVDSISNNNNNTNNDLVTVFVVDNSTAPVVEKKEMKNESESGGDVGGKKLEIRRLKSRIDELEDALRSHMNDGSFFCRPEFREKMQLQEQVQRLEAELNDFGVLPILQGFGQPLHMNPSLQGTQGGFLQPPAGLGQSVPFTPQLFNQQQQQIYHTAAVPPQAQNQIQFHHAVVPAPSQQQQQQQQLHELQELQQQQQQLQSIFRNQNVAPQPSAVPPQRRSTHQSTSNSNRNHPTSAPAPTQPGAAPPECKHQ